MTRHTETAGKIRFVLNGELVEHAVRPDTTALDLIRGHAGLKGTKEGCAEGDCGACTVLLRRDEGPRQAANACIMTAAQLDGTELTTVEGLKQNGELTELQEAMASNGSSQCGFCTPGIVMALTGLIEKNADPDEEAIHDALAGNLCRCTGYRPIVEAAKETAKSASAKTTGLALPEKQNEVAFGGSVLHQPATLAALSALRAAISRRNHPRWRNGPRCRARRLSFRLGPHHLHGAHVARIARGERNAPIAGPFGAAVTWEEILHSAVAEDYPSLATLIRRFGSTQISVDGHGRRQHRHGKSDRRRPAGPDCALGADITLASMARWIAHQ
jgi:xanthine dehydrogenase small subunit